MTTAASPPVDELSSVLTPYLSLLGALRQGATLDAERARLVEAAVDTWSRPGFDTFLSQPKLGFEPFDYQWPIAQTVLRWMRGRAILADQVLPAHGLPLTLRCLAAWWRISDRPELPAGPRPSVLVAAIHRMIGYRAGEAGVTHDAIVALHRITADETRASTPPLQARLQLSEQQPW